VNPEIEMLLARQAVVDVVVRYATGVDRRDWTLYATCFTDPCLFDFSSWTGRPAERFAPAVWAERVAGTNGKFDATQHLSSNHVVTFDGPDNATCISEMQAQHFFERSTMTALGQPDDAVNFCTLGGHYTNHLVRGDGGWRIASCTLEVRWTTGNPAIFPLARSRP
jgi:SnoaL-like domain